MRNRIQAYALVTWKKATRKEVPPDNQTPNFEIGIVMRRNVPDDNCIILNWDGEELNLA